MYHPLSYVSVICLGGLMLFGTVAQAQTETRVGLILARSPARLAFRNLRSKTAWAIVPSPASAPSALTREKLLRACPRPVTPPPHRLSKRLWLPPPRRPVVEYPFATKRTPAALTAGVGLIFASAALIYATALPREHADRTEVRDSAHFSQFPFTQGS